MSVINRVLKDLDRQGNPAAPRPAGVRTVFQPPPPARSAGLVLLTLALLAGLGLAWWWWPAAGTHSPAAPPPIPAIPPAAAPPATPQLRLSRELTPPAPDQAPMQQAEPTRPPPSTPAMAPALPAPAGSLAAPRLDTRLDPLPRAPVAPGVVKAPVPLTPAQQAEALWLEAQSRPGKGRSPQAEALLTQALKLDPAHLNARQTLAVLTLEAGRIPEAAALLREGVALHPQQGWFVRSLAQLHIQQGDYPQAAAVLKTGLTPQARGADWALYAGTLAKLNRPADTAAAWREALARDPSQGAWWIGLGLALEQDGQAPEARDAFGRALQTPLSGELRDYASRKAAAR